MAQDEAPADARSTVGSDRVDGDPRHAFVQDLRRGHYELGVEARDDRLRVAAAFDELAEAI